MAQVAHENVLDACLVRRLSHFCTVGDLKLALLHAHAQDESLSETFHLACGDDAAIHIVFERFSE